MSALSDKEVVELFGGMDAKEPRFATGGGAADDNTVDGFAVGDEFGRAMQNAVYRTDLSVYKSMEGGRRRRRSSQMKRKSRRSRKQRGGSKKQPRFQLSMKATIRLRKKQKQRQ